MNSIIPPTIFNNMDANPNPTIQIVKKRNTQTTMSANRGVEEAATPVCKRRKKPENTANNSNSSNNNK